MTTVLVNYLTWKDAPHVMLDGEYMNASEVVEVEKLTDLNSLFERVTKVDIIQVSDSDICPKCNKRIKMKGDGSIEPLCECGEESSLLSTCSNERADNLEEQINKIKEFVGL